MGQVAHSEIGASSMKRWMNCPGSVRLSRGVERFSSKYAEEGTIAHSYAEKVLMGLMDHSEIPDPEMASAVKVYTDHVIDLLCDHAVPADHIFIEKRLDLSEIHPGLFGTGDCIVYIEASKTLHVIDYKHGAGVPVEVVEDGKPNVQLMYYAAGAMYLPELQGEEIEMVVLTVVQPRCGHPDGPVRSLRLDATEMLSFAHELSVLAACTQKEDAPLKAGEWCRFCPAATQCPLLTEQANAVAKATFSALPSDPATLAQALEKLPAIESYIKAIREKAYQVVENGGSIPGYKRVAKRPSRKWNNPAEVVEFLKAKANLADADIYDLSLKSPAQMEKLFDKAGKIALKEFIISESSGFTLASENDSRPEAKPDVAAVGFTVLD